MQILYAEIAESYHKELLLPASIYSFPLRSPSRDWAQIFSRERRNRHPFSAEIKKTCPPSRLISEVRAAQRQSREAISREFHRVGKMVSLLFASGAKK